jgi:DivIVA domain-containing protein
MSSRGASPHSRRRRKVSSKPALDSSGVTGERFDPNGPIARLRTAGFKLALRGYNVDEVDAYLEDLALSLEGTRTTAPQPSSDPIWAHTTRSCLVSGTKTRGTRQNREASLRRTVRDHESTEEAGAALEPRCGPDGIGSSGGSG